MNPELEALIKAWAAYVDARGTLEDERLLSLYQSRLEDVCARTKVDRDSLHGAVLRAYQRWQWADDPAFPNPLKKLKLD